MGLALFVSLALGVAVMIGWGLAFAICACNVLSQFINRKD